MKIYSDEEFEALLTKIRKAAHNEGRQAQREETAKIEREDIPFSDVIFEFDFSNPAINVFSLERVQKENEERTVIGYYLDVPGSAPTIKEWYFSCTRKQHNMLVENWYAAIAAKTPMELPSGESTSKTRKS